MRLWTSLESNCSITGLTVVGVVLVVVTLVGFVDWGASDRVVMGWVTLSVVMGKR